MDEMTQWLYDYLTTEDIKVWESVIEFTELIDIDIKYKYRLLHLMSVHTCGITSSREWPKGYGHREHMCTIYDSKHSLTKERGWFSHYEKYIIGSGIPHIRQKKL